MWRVASLAIVLTSCACGALAAERTASANALTQAAFAPKAPPQHSPANNDTIGDLLDKNAYLPRPGDLPFSARSANDPHAESLAVIRVWPKALTFDQGDMSFDISPHAGLSHGGGSAEAGATLRVSQRVSEAVKQKLNAMGVRDGSAFGDKGRWYLFAAASGRAVGLNMLHGEQGWDRAGWTTDPASTLTGDAQVGVGWRKGPMQTSFGYIHREIKGQHMLWGVDTKPDSVVAFSLSIRPHF